MYIEPKEHSKASEIFLKDRERVHWHDDTLWFIRAKRDKAVTKLPEWEQLREQASGIKDHVLSNLNDYLVEFERKAQANGICVHWAKDAKEHNEIVHKILTDNNITKVVKSKSMLTEECGLNEHLIEYGINVVDTDLGERVVQLAQEPPSHIVLPCIHKKKEEVSDLFHIHLGTEAGNSDPAYLTESARQHLREKFLLAEASITGINFAIAETGGFVICTNEGNADIGSHLANVHIACMGIEKIIPRQADLGVFLRLLARSATGQPITTYSSHFSRPLPGQKMHIVIVDNGRTNQLGREDFRNSLKCIRCGACINTCPVYRRSGGHSYHFVVSGPIGSILAPNLDMKKNADLPFASTLCGSCTDVCPVKIDIHNQLYKWRQEIEQKKLLPVQKTVAMKIMAAVLSSPFGYRFANAALKFTMKYTPFILKIKSVNGWYKYREMPKAPEMTFKEWYKKQQKQL